MTKGDFVQYEEMEFCFTLDDPTPVKEMASRMATVMAERAPRINPALRNVYSIYRLRDNPLPYFCEHKQFDKKEECVFIDGALAVDFREVVLFFGIDSDTLRLFSLAGIDYAPYADEAPINDEDDSRESRNDGK